MFKNNLSATQRFKEYHNVARIIREMNVYGADEARSEQEKADTKALMTMLRRRHREISTAMKADCGKCFGTGHPMRFKSAFTTEYSYCASCGTDAKLTRKDIIAVIEV